MHVVCLSTSVELPECVGISHQALGKPMIKTLRRMFNFIPSEVLEIVELISQNIPPLIAFLGASIGIKLKGSKPIIKTLIKKASENKYFIPSLTDNSSSFFEIISEAKMNPEALSLLSILNECVNFPPSHLSSAEEFLHLKFFIELGNQLNSNLASNLILCFQKENDLTSFAVYLGFIYSLKYPSSFLPLVIEKLSPLSAGMSTFIDLLLTELDLSLVHWASFFVKSCLSNIGNQNPAIRKNASHSLSQLVRLLAIEKPAPFPIPELAAKKEESLLALKPLFDITTVTPFKISHPPEEVELRLYQTAGINWLGFLHKFGLNGILADDMGLGKTIQTLSVITTLQEKNQISLIVVPPAVVIHWINEIRKYFPHTNAIPLLSSESLNEKAFQRFEGFVVTSYSYFAKLPMVVLSYEYFYCVLDEGHMIKNNQTHIFQAMMNIKAKHRLILTGTPIQNNSLELWSLFEFLMPGYLGTKKEFRSKFENPIQKMFDPKATEEQTMMGQRALERLHAQVLPFILRRLKIDVLQDLPPKIISVEYCSLTPKQQQILVEISNIDENQNIKNKQEKDLLIHPCLLVQTLPRTIELSGKLLALKDLLLRLGLGAGQNNMRNRCIIFVQSQESIPFIEDLVLRSISKLTYVTYLSASNQSAIDTFQHVDGADVFLTATHIAGHGINLTAANVVIFFESDWNPMQDNQAMDRAHRLGQKKNLFVYRLIALGTIDETILQKQQEKLKVIQAIVNDENKDLRELDLTVLAQELVEVEKTRDSELGYDTEQYNRIE